MGELPRVRPKSRKAWRNWLEKNHASSKGVWLVYAKKRSRLPSLTYNDAVEEALCFGWIDSKVNPIDESFYRQVFTPRRRASAWSALNRARAERLMAAGLMTPAGLSAVNAAKESGAWNAWKDVDELRVPLDLEKAIEANPEAAREWASYPPSRRKGILYRLAAARRPETRARYLRDIIEKMARTLSHAERTVMAGFRPNRKSSRRASHTVGRLGRRPTKDLLAPLKAGYRRSVRGVSRVVDRVMVEPALFRIVFDGMADADPLVRMRCADAVEKITAVRPELLAPYRKRVIALAATAEQQEVRWHLAQLLSRLTLSAGERRQVVPILTGYLADASRIVKTFSMQALADLAMQDSRLRVPIERTLKRLTRTGSPAMKSRGRRLLARLSQSSRRRRTGRGAGVATGRRKTR